MTLNEDKQFKQRTRFDHGRPEDLRSADDGTIAKVLQPTRVYELELSR